MSDETAPAANEVAAAPPALMEQLLRTASGLHGAVVSGALRTQPDTLYTTLDDFRRADPGLKRLLVIGCTGAGKSTLLNIMGGWRFVQSPPDYDFAWESKDDDAELLFEASAGGDSVTKRAAFANLSWFGEAGRRFIAVDSPGHDDPSGAEIDSAESREKLGELAADLHNKLKALGTVNAILVLHNDVHSNRMNPATFTILKMISEKFASAGSSVWNHVCIGYSKCNEHDLSWRSGIAAKKASMQATIRSKIPSCEVDVPVIALGGASIDPPPPSHKSDEASGFDSLWDFVASAPPLDTTELQPFEGADIKWQKMINARDEAEAKAKAALIYIAVMLKVAGLAIFLLWRAFFLPRALAYVLALGCVGAAGYSFTFALSSGTKEGPLLILALAALVVNLPSILDEVAILVLFARWVGPSDVYYSLTHFYHSWLVGQIKPRWEAMVGALEKAKED